MHGFLTTKFSHPHQSLSHPPLIAVPPKVGAILTGYPNPFTFTPNQDRKTAADFRARVRSAEVKGHTSGHAPDFVQVSSILLDPVVFASDLMLGCSTGQLCGVTKRVRLRVPCLLPQKSSGVPFAGGDRRGCPHSLESGTRCRFANGLFPGC
eukprot:2889192-Rhodomonas_salina.2